MNIHPFKNEMTEQEWFEFRNTLDPDIMCFDEIEGILSNDNDLYEELTCGVSSNSDFIIKDNLTSVNFTDKNNSKRIKYIVIHYTANDGDTAWANTNYFKSTYRGASAHYFVDETNVIWRCVKDEDVAWHCGGGLQGNNGHTFYKKCTNSNSIGIEICSRKSNGKYYFKENSINNCIKLVKYLMNKYNVNVSNVIRHYDVTGKICPEPFVKNESAWNDFKERLIENKVVENKHWGQEYLDKLVNKKIINNPNEWSDLDSPVTKALTVTLLDKATGGLWKSNEANSNIHWAQPHVISLCGKRVITDSIQWITSLNDYISKALLLALVDKATGGTLNLYNNRYDVDHWGRNCLDSLCDKSIIVTPSAWIDFESQVSKAQLLALLYKALF